MKILEVLDTFYPNVDGPVNVMVNIAKILKDKGLADVELLVPDYPRKRVEIEGLKIHRVKSIKAADGYRAGLPMLNDKTKKVLKNGGYDLIHVHSPFTIGKYVVNYAKKLGIPTVLTVHTKFKSDFERVLNTRVLQNFMFKYIMKTINKADYVSTVSNGAREMLLKEYGYKGDQVEVIRNGCDLKYNETQLEVAQSIKNEYGIKDEFVFLFVGRIVENKNIQFSLQVLKELKESGIDNFKFLIVGGGEYAEELKELVKDYKLVKNVVFTGKIFDREKLSAIYQLSDLFLFPSAFDTCGIVVIEAAANKLPSVTLSGTCAAELIENGVNGFTFENDVNSWKTNLESIVNNRSGISRIKENAYKSIYVTWDEIVDEYYNYYLRVLDDYKKMKK